LLRKEEKKKGGKIIEQHVLRVCLKVHYREGVSGDLKPWHVEKARTKKIPGTARSRREGGKRG